MRTLMVVDDDNGRIKRTRFVRIVAHNTIDLRWNFTSNETAREGISQAHRQPTKHKQATHTHTYTQTEMYVYTYIQRSHQCILIHTTARSQTDQVKEGEKRK